MIILLQIAGLFTLVLGLVHFFMPVLLDFDGAIASVGPPLKPFKLLFYRYPTKRRDVLGIAWVMNHAASYTLCTIGILDLSASWWLARTLI